MCNSILLIYIKKNKGVYVDKYNKNKVHPAFYVPEAYA